MGCDGKQPFVTRRLAVDVLARMQRGRERGGSLHVYACEFGAHWHIGNRSGGAERRRHEARAAREERA